MMNKQIAAVLGLALMLTACCVIVVDRHKQLGYAVIIHIKEIE